MQSTIPLILITTSFICAHLFNVPIKKQVNNAIGNNGIKRAKKTIIILIILMFFMFCIIIFITIFFPYFIYFSISMLLLFPVGSFVKNKLKKKRYDFSVSIATLVLLMPVFLFTMGLTMAEFVQAKSEAYYITNDPFSSCKYLYLGHIGRKYFFQNQDNIKKILIVEDTLDLELKYDAKKIVY